MALYDRMHKSQRQATEKVQGKSATATSYRKAQCMSATVRGKPQKMYKVSLLQQQATERHNVCLLQSGKLQKRYKVSLLQQQATV